MRRAFDTFLGIDLGGGKGKNTAVARLKALPDGTVEIQEVATSDGTGTPFYDDVLVDWVGRHAGPGTAVAMDAPLTLPACVRCPEAVCPGTNVCTDPSIIWFRSTGQALVDRAREADGDRIASLHGDPDKVGKPSITPYTQRATEIILHRRYGILPRETLGQGMGPLTARAAHLVRALGRFDFGLHRNLIEVYPKATLHQLFSSKVARSYRRHVDTWSTRARVLETWSNLQFGPHTGLARESVFSNDHCFDAVVCAYTAYLWARDGWELPTVNADVYRADGWIYAPGVDADVAELVPPLAAVRTAD